MNTDGCLRFKVLKGAGCRKIIFAKVNRTKFKNSNISNDFRAKKGTMSSQLAGKPVRDGNLR